MTQNFTYVRIMLGEPVLPKKKNVSEEDKKTIF